MKILEYNQEKGFKEIEANPNWETGETESDWLKKFGFSSCEEADGTTFIFNQHDYDNAIKHYFSDDGRRMTCLEGVNKYEYVLTYNPADFVALRVLLAPLALVQSFDELLRQLVKHGTIGDTPEERRTRVSRG